MVAPTVSSSGVSINSTSGEVLSKDSNFSLDLTSVSINSTSGEVLSLPGCSPSPPPQEEFPLIQLPEKF